MKMILPIKWMNKIMVMFMRVTNTSMITSKTSLLMTQTWILAQPITTTTMNNLNNKNKKISNLSYLINKPVHKFSFSSTKKSTLLQLMSNSKIRVLAIKKVKASNNWMNQIPTLPVAHSMAFPSKTILKCS